MTFLDCTLLYNRGSTNFDKNLVYFFYKKNVSLFTTTQKGNVKGVPYMPEMQLESEWQLYFLLELVEHLEFQLDHHLKNCLTLYETDSCSWTHLIYQ